MRTSSITVLMICFWCVSAGHSRAIWPFSSRNKRENSDTCHWIADYETKRLDRDYIIKPKHSSFQREPSMVALNLTEDDACGGRGQSLAVRWNKQRAGWCGYYAVLKDRFNDPVDLSGFNELVFQVRGKEGGEIFQLTVGDRAMQERETDGYALGFIDEFLKQGVTREWQEVRVPLVYVDPRTDLKRMGVISWSFTEPGEGEIFIDDVCVRRTKKAPMATPVMARPKNTPTPIKPAVGKPQVVPTSKVAWSSGTDVGAAFTQAPAKTEEDTKKGLARAYGPVTERIAGCPKAMWVWKSDPVRNVSDRVEVLDFCRKTGVERIYLYRPVFHNRGEGYRNRMGECLRAFHDAGIEVYGLSGDASWWASSRHKQVLSMLDDYLVFNQSRPAAERFDGLQLDIEPYVTSAWRKDRLLVKENYLLLLGKLHEARDLAGSLLQLDLAVPVMYASEDDGAFLRGILEQVDSLALMDYYDNAGKVIAQAEPFVRMAGETGKKVWIGLETQDLVRMGQGQFSNTYYDEGWGVLERDLEKIADHYTGQAGFGGVAVHTYYTYRKLPEIGKRPTRRRPEPAKVRSMKMESRRAEVPVVLDGKLDEWRGEGPALTNRKQVVFGVPSWKGVDDLSAKAWSMHDDEMMYFAFEVVDDQIVQAWSGADMWRGDHVELWLDVCLTNDYYVAVNDQDDIQFGFSPGDFAEVAPECFIFTGNRSYEPDEIGMGVRRTDDGYRMEVAIPRALIFQNTGEAPVTVELMGYSIDPSDCDSPTQDQETLMSTSVARRWGDPTTFGVLFFNDDIQRKQKASEERLRSSSHE